MLTGERIRDKIAASKRKGMWMGGTIPLGYNIQDKQLIANKAVINLLARETGGTVHVTDGK